MNYGYGGLPSIHHSVSKCFQPRALPEITHWWAACCSASKGCLLWTSLQMCCQIHCLPRFHTLGTQIPHRCTLLLKRLCLQSTDFVAWCLPQLDTHWQCVEGRAGLGLPAVTTLWAVTQLWLRQCSLLCLGQQIWNSMPLRSRVANDIHPCDWLWCLFELGRCFKPFHVRWSQRQTGQRPHGPNTWLMVGTTLPSVLEYPCLSEWAHDPLTHQDSRSPGPPRNNALLSQTGLSCKFYGSPPHSSPTSSTPGSHSSV